MVAQIQSLGFEKSKKNVNYFWVRSVRSLFGIEQYRVLRLKAILVLFLMIPAVRLFKKS